jgi:hypothetical protein
MDIITISCKNYIKYVNALCKQTQTFVMLKDVMHIQGDQKVSVHLKITVQNTSKNTVF